MQSKKVFYSKGGISLILDDVSDLFKDQINSDINKVIINTSSQPNSNPHLGTLTTISCAFALAKKIEQRFNVSVEVEFDELENSPYLLEEHENELSLEFINKIKKRCNYKEFGARHVSKVLREELSNKINNR